MLTTKRDLLYLASCSYRVSLHKQPSSLKISSWQYFVCTHMYIIHITLVTTYLCLKAMGSLPYMTHICMATIFGEAFLNFWWLLSIDFLISCTNYPIPKQGHQIQLLATLSGFRNRDSISVQLCQLWFLHAGQQIHPGWPVPWESWLSLPTRAEESWGIILQEWRITSPCCFLSHTQAAMGSGWLMDKVAGSEERTLVTYLGNASLSLVIMLRDWVVQKSHY